MVKKLLSIFIFFTFISRPISNLTGIKNVILKRVTISDIFGGLAILSAISILIYAIRFSKKISNVYQGAFILVLSFFLPIAFSLNIPATIMEIVILIFLILISILIFYVYKNDLFNSLFPILINATLAAAALGFYDVFAPTLGLPRIFPEGIKGDVTSGFRNGGQAGAYFMVFIALFYPLKNTDLFNKLDKKNRFKLRLAIAIGILFLFATGKIAAYIGFVIGIGLYAIYNRKIKNLLTITIFSVLLFFVYMNIENIAPTIKKRIDRKYETRITQNLDGSSNSNFFEKNWGGAIRAFKDNPISGTGIGGYYQIYDQYEVHSTYLKMIGETGILGSLGYILFMTSFIFMFKIPNRTTKNNPYYNYLKQMTPFIIGCLISWSYTYHIRKREFWIMTAVLMIVVFQAKLYDYNKKVALN